MNRRRDASAKPKRQSGVIIPDHLRVPSARERLTGGWNVDQAQALDEARRDWFHSARLNIADYRDRAKAERGV